MIVYIVIEIIVPIEKNMLYSLYINFYFNGEL